MSVTNLTQGLLNALTAVSQNQNAAEHSSVGTSQALGSQDATATSPRTEYAVLAFTSPTGGVSFAVIEISAMPFFLSNSPTSDQMAGGQGKTADPAASDTKSDSTSVNHAALTTTSPAHQTSPAASDTQDPFLRTNSPTFLSTVVASGVTTPAALRTADNSTLVTNLSASAAFLSQTNTNTTDTQNLTNLLPVEARNGTTGPIDPSQPSGVNKIVRPTLPSLTALVGGAADDSATTRPPAPPATDTLPRNDGQGVRPAAGDMNTQPMAPALPEQPTSEDQPLETVEDVEGWMTEGGLSYWMVGLALTGTALERVRHRSQTDEETKKHIGL